MDKGTDDPAMTRVRALFEKSRLSLHDLGLKMGYAPDVARKAAWQFMRTKDPRISMLRRFAKAMAVPLSSLTGTEAGKQRQPKARRHKGEEKHGPNVEQVGGS